jgi:hypothetical protein
VRIFRIVALRPLFVTTGRVTGTQRPPIAISWRLPMICRSLMELSCT